MARIIVEGAVEAPVLALTEGLSFWGGVDPASGRIIDAYHPAHGESLSGRILMMPTSRGSCTGSGVLLELALAGHAPAALVFREHEDILTLGALIASWMFGHALPVLRLGAADYDRLAASPRARITPCRLEAAGLSLDLAPLPAHLPTLSEGDQAMLDGAHGEAARFAMETIRVMAAAQGAETLIDVTRAHIDGCIYVSPANLRFAEAMCAMRARVRVPTTMNAISVDHAHWRAQGVAPDFGLPAARLADAYVEMGAQPSFTCAPYLLDHGPRAGERIAWAESNAVIYANSVLAARSVKHPDFLDLCIALTGRAPLSGVYLDAERAPARIIEVAPPEGHDDSFWPLLGYLAGELSPDRIPLITGLEHLAPDADDLKALCAAFGTTSGAPMLHVAGHTPEAGLAPRAGADRVRAGRAGLARVWARFNAGGEEIDLVAFGSPHFSYAECRKLADLVEGQSCRSGTVGIVTVGRDTLQGARADGVLARLEAAGLTVVPDICWCSITEPVFPPQTKVLMTNSGKYAHYAPGLCAREVRFGSLADCVAAVVRGRAPAAPAWLN